MVSPSTFLSSFSKTREAAVAISISIPSSSSNSVPIFDASEVVFEVVAEVVFEVVAEVVFEVEAEVAVVGDKGIKKLESPFVTLLPRMALFAFTFLSESI